MAGELAEMVFTDPPYNMPIDGHVSGHGRVRHHDFAMASGEMSEDEFTAFLRTVFERLAGVSRDGAIHFMCMDWRHLGEMLAAGRAVCSELKNLVVWNKTNGGMGSFYRSKHELEFVWKIGTAPHVNTFDLGQHGRYRTNVWDYAGVNTMRAGRLEELAMHPTVKPVAMVADAIKDCSRRKGIILDPFMGSGTTLIAAERTGRRARGIELDPAYVEVAVWRWQSYTGKRQFTRQSLPTLRRKRFSTCSILRRDLPPLALPQQGPVSLFSIVNRTSCGIDIRCSCSVQEYGRPRVSAVAVRPAGAVPSMMAVMIRGDTKASGARLRMCCSAFPSRRAMSAKLWPRSTSFIHLRALAMAISTSCRLPGFIGVLCAGT
jgi:DNA modification methylase